MRTIYKISIILILQLFSFQQVIFAQDTTDVSSISRRHSFNADPMKATMLAVTFPGMGQVYNRKYWKVPLVYAGFGALVYAIGFNTSHYNDFMGAYQDFIDKIPETNSYMRYVKGIDPSEYDPVQYPDTYDPSSASWVEDGLLMRVDSYKRYRDLSYIGIAVWYLVTVLDANVDASLFNYDISDNLDLAVVPARLPVAGTLGAGFNVSLKLNF